MGQVLASGLFLLLLFLLLQQQLAIHACVGVRVVRDGDGDEGGSGLLAGAHLAQRQQLPRKEGQPSWSRGDGTVLLAAGSDRRAALAELSLPLLHTGWAFTSLLMLMLRLLMPCVCV